MRARRRLQVYFNSRPSARGDRRGCGQGDGCRCISIHAPPRGATRELALHRAHPQFQFTPLREGRRTPQAGQDDSVPFQFTPLREGRLAKRGSIVEQFQFQFTPLREGRRLAGCVEDRAFYFNSRPSARGDRRSGPVQHVRPISIHAPPRGATCRACPRCRARRHFNSRPSARGDRNTIC